MRQFAESAKLRWAIMSWTFWVFVTASAAWRRIAVRGNLTGVLTFHKDFKLRRLMSDLADRLKQVVHQNPQHAERSLVFQALGGFVEFLEAELGVFEEGFVVDQFADAPLA